VSRWRRGARWGLGLAGGAAALELLAALVLPAPYPDRRPLVAVAPDPALGYRLVPGQATFSYQAPVETNADGLRERPLAALTGPRVLVLGGSETFGKGVPAEATFARRLEASLPGGHTVNAGAPDWTLDQSAAFLETRGATLAPAGVVLALYWDDLFPTPLGDAPAPGAPRGEWGPRAWARRSGVLPYLAPLYTRSRVIMAARNGLKGASQRLRGAPEHRWPAALLAGTMDPELDAAWARAQGNLQRVADRCRALGAWGVVVLLPLEAQVTGSYPQASFQSEARRRAEAAGLLVVDPLPALRAAHRAGAALFIPYDGRPTAAGHAVVAEVLAEAVADYQQTP
jgi:hypothetical protein